MKHELLPQVHIVQNTDLIEFAYLLHVLAGDFLSNIDLNINSFCYGSLDYIAVMGQKNIRLYDYYFAYQASAELHQTMFTTEQLTGHAFLFHAERKENGKLFGDILMFDSAILREDVEKHTIFPVGVEVEYQSGEKKKYSLSDWREMQLYQKNVLKSWGERYSSTDLKTLKQHYSTFFEELKKISVSFSDIDLLERLNLNYMENAKYPQDGFYRIPHRIAKTLLMSDSVPIYRLFPEGAEKIAPLAAITNGLWYTEYREFAIRSEDISILLCLCQKEVLRHINRHPEKNSTSIER